MTESICGHDSKCDIQTILGCDPQCHTCHLKLWPWGQTHVFCHAVRGELPACLKFTASTGLYLPTVSLKPTKTSVSNTWVLPWLPATRECSHGCAIFLIQRSWTLILCTWWGSLTYTSWICSHLIKQQVFLSCFSCSGPRWYTLFLLICGSFHMILILCFDRHCRCYFLGCFPLCICCNFTQIYQSINVYNCLFGMHKF